MFWSWLAGDLAEFMNKVFYGGCLAVPAVEMTLVLRGMLTLPFAP